MKVLKDNIDEKKQNQPEYDWYVIKTTTPVDNIVNFRIDRITKGKKYKTSSCEEIVYSSIQ